MITYSILAHAYALTLPEIAVSAYAQLNVIRNPGNCPPLAKISASERKSGAPNPKEVTE